MYYSFTDRLKRWSGESSWHFVYVPARYWNELRMFSQGTKRGFGSIKVYAQCGASSWQTSIFPDTNTSQFILFIKKAVRSAEKLELDADVPIKIAIQM
jgi:hypothetical protein